jgi:hypothetical protein
MALFLMVVAYYYPRELKKPSKRFKSIPTENPGAIRISQVPKPKKTQNHEPYL